MNEAELREVVDRIESLLNQGQADYRLFHTDVAALLGYGTDDERASAKAKTDHVVMTIDSRP
jgi:hypothetical protein